MPQFKPYPNSTTTPSRKSRKGSRNTVFIYNKKLVKQMTKERRLARVQSAE